MKVDEFDFELPDDRIAQQPVSPRDTAKLLHVEGEHVSDCDMRELPALLHPGDLLIFNNTRVIPARLKGKRGTASVELTLHKYEGPSAWRAFAKPARKLSEGDIVTISEHFSAEVIEKLENGEVIVMFNVSDEALSGALATHGEMPLPPYIKRNTPDTRDALHYQTIFAEKEGAVAAPTAGLHFTPALLDQLHHRGIRSAAVTLHVGAGTFLPVKASDTKDHVMHSEWYDMPRDTVLEIRKTREAGGRVVAVGTTSMRVLEAVAKKHGTLQHDSGETDIFITPGYQFKEVDVLLTNFHLPRSTLFMLVCAFAGTEEMKRAYYHAIRMKYRFYSYGDACLLERKKHYA